MWHVCVTSKGWGGWVVFVGMIDRCVAHQVLVLADLPKSAMWSPILRWQSCPNLCTLQMLFVVQKS